METKYTKMIHFFLEEPIGGKAFFQWIFQQPLIDQPDILREYKQIIKTDLEQNGGAEVNFSVLDEQIAIYEETILDVKLSNLKLNMLLEELYNSPNPIKEILVEVREYLMNCILNNEDNAKAIKKIIIKIIANEKENELFEEANWKPILHLLD